MKVISSHAARKIVRSLYLIVAALLFGVVAIKPAQAHIIDSVEVNHVGDEAEIQIHFDVSIQYLSNAQLKNGEIHVFISLLESDPDSTRLVPEHRDSPPSDFAPHFSVSFPALDTSLVIKFDQTMSYRIVPGEDRHSISIFTPALVPKTGPQSRVAPSAHTQAETERQAKQLIDSARNSLKQGKTSVAIQSLNQLLSLPPNQESQAAHALIGTARELNGEFAKAREAYEQYLKLYPDAKDAKLVQSRLAGLPAVPQPQEAPAPSAEAKPQELPPSSAESQPQEAPAVITPEEVERQAKQLMDSARNALNQGKTDSAIETLNQLLNLPPNQQSQAAQALIGDAREKNGEYGKARVEYELYLKLYPDAKDVKLIQKKLSALPAEQFAKVTPQAARRNAVDERMMVYGSFSQNYYTGMSHTETSTANGLSVTTDSLTSTDQSTLLTSLDLTARKRTESTDTRIVLRNDYSANFLANSSNDNRLNALYVEQSARDHHYFYRLGRQSGTTGGVLGRFDGAWLAYSPSSSWRVNGVLGSPVEYYSTGTDTKTFAGLSVDLTRQPEQWSGSGYFIEQRVGSVIDRKAVGLEAHYFDARRSYMGLLDYDTLFKAFNIATFQGNWNSAGGNSYNLLLDHRKSPSLEITNALPGQASQSISSLIQSGVSVESLLADAEALTAISNLFMVGMTHPYSSHLRLGGDFRITNTSGTEAAGTLPAAPGTGNIYIISAQAIGNNLFLENDLGLVSASYINARTYKGQSLAVTQSDTLRQRWRLDASLLLYNQNDNLGVRQTRITPSLKLNYRMNESMSFDVEGGIESTHTTSSTQDQKVTRRYVYLGYRWDFQ